MVYPKDNFLTSPLVAGKHHLITTINEQSSTQLLGESGKLPCLVPEKARQRALLVLGSHSHL